ncbi:MAG: phosphotransferase [Anaerolineales bacterium]|nr:phosphotransferase [Anaerolineales bacterium]
MTALGEVLAVGRTAEIYAWHEGQVLKLFHNWFSLENIQYEQRLNRLVHEAGVPSPQVGEIVRVDGRNGLVYERLDGDSMGSLLRQQPGRVLVFARRTAELQARMHATAISLELPAQRARLQRKIAAADPLPAAVKQAALTALESLPDGDRVCHGDFHPGNIQMTSGDPVIIDWIDATRGNPLADVARTSVLALGAAGSTQTSGGVKVFLHLFHAAYLRHYFRLRPGGQAEYRRWLPVVAAARLSENIPELENWLIARARKGLPTGP